MVERLNLAIWKIYGVLDRHSPAGQLLIVIRCVVQRNLALYVAYGRRRKVCRRDWADVGVASQAISIADDVVKSLGLHNRLPAFGMTRRNRLLCDITFAMKTIEPLGPDIR